MVRLFIFHLGTTMINTMEESSSEEEEEKEEDIIAVSTSLEPSCGDDPGYILILILARIGG